MTHKIKKVVNKMEKIINKKETKQVEFHSSTLKRLFKYMASYKWPMVIVVVCVLLSALASAGSALFIEILIDDYIMPLIGNQNPDWTSLIIVLAIMAGIYLVGVLSSLFYSRLMVTIAQGTLKKIRDEMFKKMQLLPVSYFDKHTHGEIMSLYTNDTDTLRQMIAQSLVQLINSVFTILAVFCCMLYISIWLTIVVLAVMGFILVIAKKVMKKSGSYFISQQKNLADLNSYVEEMVNGAKVVKVFCYEKKSCDILNKKNKDWEKSSGYANGNANMMMPMMNALGYIQYVIIAIFGGYMAIMSLTNFSLVGFNILTLGMIASFLSLSRSFTNPISQLANQYNSIVTALAGAERIFKFMDEKPEIDNGYVSLVNANIGKDGEPIECKEKTLHWAWKHIHQDNSPTTYVWLKGEIVLDHVDFSYVPNKLVLHDITIKAEPGKKIALVGATGAGKTTITNLINRFYDIDDGKIRYDGININKIKKYDLRKSLGVVLQDVHLFTGTIMENIRYGNEEASDDDCINAAKLANANGFIEMLPKGYQTVISGDGEGLSQGQRQLLSIARAAVANPPVMILDEATSSIDTRTEKLVQDGMDKLMNGRTTFVIAHRLSTVQNSDVILVLDHGSIIERGTHEELIAKNGTYYQLYTGAFELE